MEGTAMEHARAAAVTSNVRTVRFGMRGVFDADADDPAPRRSAAVQETEGVGVVECLPGRGDHVLVDTDRVPLAHTVRRSDQHARHRTGAVRALQDPDLVVDELERT